MANNHHEIEEKELDIARYIEVTLRGCIVFVADALRTAWLYFFRPRRFAEVLSPEEHADPDGPKVMRPLTFAVLGACAMFIMFGWVGEKLRQFVGVDKDGKPVPAETAQPGVKTEAPAAAPAKVESAAPVAPPTPAAPAAPAANAADASKEHVTEEDKKDAPVSSDTTPAPKDSKEHPLSEFGVIWRGTIFRDFVNSVSEMEHKRILISLAPKIASVVVFALIVCGVGRVLRKFIAFDRSLAVASYHSGAQSLILALCVPLYFLARRSDYHATKASFEQIFDEPQDHWFVVSVLLFLILLELRVLYCCLVLLRRFLKCGWFKTLAVFGLADLVYVTGTWVIGLVKGAV